MSKLETELSAQQLFNTRQALPSVKEEVTDGAARSTTASTELSDGWRPTLIWVMSILSWYMLLQRAVLPFFMQTNPDARAKLLEQVPVRLYEYSESAFFTAMVLNLLSFIFEETAPKRQLALLSALIKGLSWHCDTLIVGGKAVIKFDRHGALLLPSRYVQWSCTTPTMLFTLAKISNLSPAEVTAAIIMDVTMVFSGWIAAELPFGPLFTFFTVLSFASWVGVMYMMYRMIRSARDEAVDSNHAKACLNFTWDSSLIIWSLFPTGWVLARTGVPWLAAWGEPLFLFSNFAAKVVFSSCILYNNFVTIAQRRLMAQLEQEHRDRVRMVEDLKETVQSKDEFISVIGHELRTPLNAIIQLSNAIARGAGGKLETKATSWMETIASSATHLLGIINDIITMKATRTLQVKQDLVNIAPTVDTVLRTLAPMAKRGVLLQKIMCETMPPMVGDGRRLMQALSNVVGNALKFTDKGTVTVRVAPTEDGRNIVVKIIDSGCGIPKEKLPSLFKPFRQVDMSSKRKYGGTGLGLSITKQLVEAHQGSIKAESAVGVGTTIIITLPVLQRETRSSLEQSFRDAYVAAGFSFEQLIAPVEMATGAPRTAPVFRTSLDSSSGRSNRRSTGAANRQGTSSIISSPSVTSASSSTMKGQSGRGSIDMSTAVVEQYRWSEEFDDYNPNSNQLPAKQVVDYDDDEDGVEEDEEEDYAYDPAAHVSAAGALQGGPPGLAVALMSDLYEADRGVAAPVDDTNDDGDDAEDEEDGAWKRGIGEPDRATPDKAVPEYWVPEAHGGVGPPVKEAANDPDAYHPALKGAENFDAEDEESFYAGNWHKPGAFVDGIQDKDHYKSSNRMSYEYRPSLDFQKNDVNALRKGAQGPSEEEEEEDADEETVKSAATDVQQSFDPSSNLDTAEQEAGSSGATAAAAKKDLSGTDEAGRRISWQVQRNEMYFKKQ